jgi:hypothetical protein
MRLRLFERLRFERLRRLVGWRAGSRAQERDQTRGSRAREETGKHRRNAVAPRAHGTAAARHAQASPSAGITYGQPPSPGAYGQPPPADTYGQPPPAGNAGAWPGRPPVHAARGGGRTTAGSHRSGGGGARARIREAPFGAAPVETATAGNGLPEAAAADAPGIAVPRQPWYQVVGEPASRADTRRAANGSQRASLPFAEPHPRGFPDTADGRRNCGALEAVLWRQWDAAATPPPQVVAAIDRLAELPGQLQEKLATALDGIYVGAGGVPDLDDMAALHGVPLPSGHATWDACAGAYGERKIVVGSRPSPTPDVLCHEVGHALDDIDSPSGKWQSDSAEFRMLYEQCQPHIASDFHRQRGGLGRKEFFADAFAAIASAQRPALVDMLSGNTRAALMVMLYFNRRYGI